MSTFDALTLAFEDWFDTPLDGLPETVRQRVEQEFFPMPWDKLSANQRRSVALQLDYQHDPATAQDQKFWWDFFERMNSLKTQVAEWEAVATPTAAELALTETRLTELKQELARMDAQQRLARGDYFPERKPSQNVDGAPSTGPTVSARYIAYPNAMYQLTQRLAATPEELAAWIWLGPKDGGLAAYLNANELVPPPRFFYATGGDTHDYIAPLMACWFREEDINQFEPVDRYIVGAALIERWNKIPGLHAVAFIQAKIAESRLLDIHPIFGGTRGTLSEHSDLPSLESGLFPLSHIRQIEAEDFPEFSFANTTTAKDQSAKEPDDTVHVQGGVGIREPTKSQGSTVRRDARKLITQSMYKEWQKAYRAVAKERPDMSDVWYSRQIAKLPIAKKRAAETIRKYMRP
jgi:hypothetical protein